MDDNLLGYVLKALDPAEEREVEAYLEAHPEAQARAEMLRQALAPLAADAEAGDAPAGLAVATLARIVEATIPSSPPPAVVVAAESTVADSSPLLRLPAAPELPPSQWSRPWPHLLRRADLLVAASLMILVGGLFSPWLVGRWGESERVNCVNNLKSFWFGLDHYSKDHDGRYPQVLAQDGPRGFAGSVVPVLRESGIPLETVNVSCPSTGRTGGTVRTLQELEALQRDHPAEFMAAIQQLLPGYAYSLGYEDGNELRGLERGQEDRQVLMADRPAASGTGNSPNHHGAGQNVLYVGGNVGWLKHRIVGEDRDDIYLNRRNLRQAGLDQADAVLGPSDAKPYPR